MEIQESKLSLEEERQNLQDAMRKALANDDMPEYHRLNGHFQILDKKIRKGKK